jgi:hypothetical protein
MFPIADDYVQIALGLGHTREDAEMAMVLLDSEMARGVWFPYDVDSDSARSKWMAQPHSDRQLQQNEFQRWLFGLLLDPQHLFTIEAKKQLAKALN